MAKLKNKRQELFCQNYVTEINGTLFNGCGSAIKAGYSKKTAASQASRLLTNVNIKQRINELKAGAIEKLELNQLLALTKLKHIITDDISNYMSWKTIEVEYINPLTGQTMVGHVLDQELVDSTTIDTWNVSEAGKTKDGFKIKLHCKDKAVNKLMDYLKMFDPEDVNKTMAPVVIVNDLPESED